MELDLHCGTCLALRFEGDLVTGCGHLEADTDLHSEFSLSSSYCSASNHLLLSS